MSDIEKSTLGDDNTTTLGDITKPKFGDGALFRHVPGFPARTAPGSAEPRLPGRQQGFAQQGRARQGAEPEKFMPPEILLRATGLAIGWGKGRASRTLASGIGLSVPAGRLIALVGPNGSGKSTLLRSLCGLQSVIAGKIMLEGKDLGTLSAEERARSVACVFNEKLDSGYFSVFDIVAFGRYPYTDARNRLGEKDRAKVIGALAAVGMESFAERRFSDLSDGEKQKVNIARAIAQDTGLLVLDEPTAFLDAPSRIEIFHLAGSLAHEGGKAIVVCTHEVDLALRSADEMWIMDREHRFLSGTPAVVAYSGAIGRAFATPNVHFDPATGGFKVSGMERKGLRG